MPLERRGPSKGGLASPEPRVTVRVASRSGEGREAAPDTGLAPSRRAGSEVADSATLRPGRMARARAATDPSERRTKGRARDTSSARPPRLRARRREAFFVPLARLSWTAADDRGRSPAHQKDVAGSPARAEPLYPCITVRSPPAPRCAADGGLQRGLRPRLEAPPRSGRYWLVAGLRRPERCTRCGGGGLVVVAEPAERPNGHDQARPSEQD
jgi:hypothetical protein